MLKDGKTAYISKALERPKHDFKRDQAWHGEWIKASKPIRIYMLMQGRQDMKECKPAGDIMPGTEDFFT